MEKIIIKPLNGNIGKCVDVKTERNIGDRTKKEYIKY
jgi:hypothetical protein